MKKKRLQWFLPCSLAVALSLPLVAAPAQASPVMPANVRILVEPETQQREAQLQARFDERQAQIERMAKEKEERMAANTQEALITRILAEQKALQDANEAMKQAQMEKALSQYQQSLSDVERQKMEDRLNREEKLQRSDKEPQMTPRSVGSR